MRSQRLQLLFLLAAVGYIVLTVLVATHVFDTVDGWVFQYGAHHRNTTLYAAAKHYTDIFTPVNDTACLSVGAAILAWQRRRPAVFVAAAMSAAAMAAIVLSSKAALGRPLPYTRPGRHADAFPSGHTATFLVCFGTLALLATTRHRKLRPPLLAAVGVGTVLVGISLVYDGFHWLTDTVSSAILGISLLSAFVLAADSGPRRRPPPHR